MRFLVAGLSLLLCAQTVWAEEIRFMNGDRLSGEITKVTAEKVSVNTYIAGELEFDHAQIDTINSEEASSYLAVHHPVEEEAAEEPETKWSRTASIGYTQSGGNTEKSQFNAAIKLNRKTDDDEATLKWTGFYASSNEVTDAKKFYGMARYARSFGDLKKWYHFARLEADQDIFSNIKYRITPSYGLGYWFADDDDFKAMLEGALGYTHTKYRTSGSDGEMALIPRAYLEKLIWGNLRLSEDVTLYPSLEDTGEFRLHSETSLISPITERLSWKVSFIDDYDSDPQGASENNDYRLITGIDITF